MKNLLWLASYPKSGNTWMRIFLGNLQKGGEEPADINKLEDYRSNNRKLFDQFSGLKSSLLTDTETLHIRHEVYKYLDAAQEKLTLIKTHAPYLCNSEGKRLFPDPSSRGAIYLIRNPLDLAASLANHNKSTIDESINLMTDETYTLSPNRNGNPSGHLFEPVSSWDQNVTSWVEECEFPLLLIRYEDMVSQPFETFSRAAQFAGLSEDPDQIRQAIEHSSFEALRGQEQQKGFREKPKTAENFFRKGKVGSWREELTPEQAQRIIDDHGTVMRKFGYLKEDGTPVY